MAFIICLLHYYFNPNTEVLLVIVIILDLTGVIILAVFVFTKANCNTLFDCIRNYFIFMMSMCPYIDISDLPLI